MPKYNLLEEEIKWCKAHRNPKEKKYQDGFISGLEHALWLMKSRPTPRALDGAKAPRKSKLSAGLPRK